MALPRGLGRFQNRVTNRIVGRFAAVLPGFGLVDHVGRYSGRGYRTPLNTFAVDGGFAIVVAYGERSDWCRNLLASGGGSVVHRRRRYTLSGPRIVTGHDALRLLPLYGRLLCRVAGERRVLVLSAAPA